MKALLLSSTAALFLCQCGMSGGGDSLHGYRLGLMKGGADAAAGLSCEPVRYESEYSHADRDEFFRGYQRGFHREKR